MNYIVICRFDPETIGKKGRYVTASSKVFSSYNLACSYAKTVSPSRVPLVLPAWLSWIVPDWRDVID